jgi:deazaflavin-dependent oxidoreductase (nitroreductase family)
MNGNVFMAWILHSPFHGIFGKGMMLITLTGRKTGKTYTIPVGYYEEGGSLWVMSSRDRTWWRNLNGGSKVELFLKRASVGGFAETELNESAVNKRMKEYIQHVPQAARPLGIRVEGGAANLEDIARSARGRLFIQIRPLPTG